MNTTKWSKKDGIFYLSVTSHGLTGKEWLERFSKTGIEVSDRFKYHLSPEDFSYRLIGGENFKATKGIIYELAVVDVESLIPDSRHRTTHKIRRETRGLKVIKNLEVACLLADELSSKEFKLMGFKQILGLDKSSSDITNALTGDSPLVFNMDFYYRKKRFDIDVDSQVLHTYRKGAGFVFIVSETNLSSLEPVTDGIHEERGST